MTLRRAVIVLAILILGGVSVSRLDVRYASDVSASDVVVRLFLPSSASDVATVVANRWAVPLESAIRSAGDVAGMRSSVSPDGVQLLVRFEPGTDTRKKLARLGDELAPIRAQLPPGGDVVTWAGPARNESARLFLTGTEEIRVIRRIRDSFETLPSVGRVAVSDDRRDELRITLDDRRPGMPGASEIAELVRKGDTTESLGEWQTASFRLPVVKPSDSSPLAERRVSAKGRVVALGSIARLERTIEEREGEGRWNGKYATAFFLTRHSGTPVLRFDREIRSAVERLNATLPAESRIVVADSEAEPLRRMLRLIATGLALAIPALALLGWWSGRRRGAMIAILFVPLALALAAIAFHLAKIALDSTTLPAVCVGLVSAVPLLLLPAPRRGGWQAVVTTAVAASLVGIAAALATGSLAPYLAPPARVFFIAAVASAAAAMILPAIATTPRAEGRATFAKLSREAGTTLLAASALAFALFTLFGRELDPRSAAREPDRRRITVSSTMPEGSTLGEARNRAELIERKLATVDGVERTWGWIAKGDVFLVAEVAPGRRTREEYADLQLRLTMRLRRAAGGAIRVGDSSDGGGGSVTSLVSPIEQVASTDEEAKTYTALLLGADLDDVSNAVERVTEVLRRPPLQPGRTELGTRSLRVELSLRPDADPADVARMAASLVSASSPGDVVPQTRDYVVKVRRTGAPATSEEIPIRRQLIEKPVFVGDSWVVPASLASVRERVVKVGVPRQEGRFAALVSTSTFMPDKQERMKTRESIDRALRNVTLPPGVGIQLPEIRPLWIAIGKWRLYAMIAALPLLVLLMAMIWSNSTWRPLAVFLPLVVGVGSAAAFVWFAGASLEELSLELLAAALCAALPGLLLVVPPASADEHLIAASYRAGRGTFHPLLGGSVIALVVLAIPAFGADPAADPWAVPLRAAGFALAGSLAAGMVLPSSVLFSAVALRRRLSPENRRLRRPPEWTERGVPVLEIHRVTKLYRNGVRALHDVSFELRPGVVGLLGPNGAGKTTLLRIMTGLIEPTRGEPRYRGVPVGAANLGRYREHIGFLPQDFNAYPGFTAEQFLDYWAMERGMTDRRQRTEEIELLLAAVGLEEHAKRRVRDFSGGMKQRIGIARALLGTPELLVVDEPTTGLDIEGRSRFRGLIMSIAAHRIVVLSTHIAGDVEATCSRVLLLHRGVLRFDGAPDGLIARAEGQVFESVVSDQEALEISRTCRVTRRVRVLDGVRLRGVVSSGVALPGPPVTPSLEDAYIVQIEQAEAAKGPPRRFAFLHGEAARRLD